HVCRRDHYLAEAIDQLRFRSLQPAVACLTPRGGSFGNPQCLVDLLLAYPRGGYDMRNRLGREPLANDLDQLEIRLGRSYHRKSTQECVEGIGGEHRKLR